MRESEALSNKEKALVALAAAMGAGCRTCSERLRPMAVAAGATADEIELALRDGLTARESATEAMRRKAEALLGAAPGSGSGREVEANRRMRELTKLAAAAAANSAPDAVRYLQEAEKASATQAEVRTALGIARRVRTKAQGFSDTEIDEAQSAEKVRARAADSASVDARLAKQALCCS